MRTTLKLLFSMRKPKNYQSGDMPIYLRITVDGQRAKVAVSRKFDPSRWDTHLGRSIGTKANAKALNFYPEGVQGKLHELHRQMTEADANTSAETLKNRFIGKVEKARTLITVFEDHNQKMKSLVGQGFEKSTLQRYETAFMA